MRDSAFGLPSDCFCNAAVEALDETVGLRPIRSGEAVVNSVIGTDAIKGVAPRGAIFWLVLHVDSKAISKLTAVIGKDRVNEMREVSEKALEESFCRRGVALGMYFQKDVAGRPIDGDEGIALLFFQGRQMFEIDVNEADSRFFKYADRRLVRFGAPVESMPNQATMDGATGKLRVGATIHDLNDIVERQL